jgi:hypothetical protein
MRPGAAYIALIKIKLLRILAYNEYAATGGS